MEENYKLLSTVLKKLQNAGALQHLILAGSWCQYFYRILFAGAAEIPLLRTTDIDFLIPNPPGVKQPVDVSKILIELGFDEQLDYKTGLVKYVHPDLEIQFLTPERGRGQDTPYTIKNLHINAEGLRYLNLLQNHNFEMQHDGITIRIPEPEAFALQKILASQERKDPDKKEKDLLSAQAIGEFCLQDKKRRTRIKTLFMSLPQKWQKKILTALKYRSADLQNWLSGRE